MAGGGDGKEQNYWPGFVDALSNVVLTLVFVLVVFVFALVVTSGKVQQKSAQIVEQKIEQEKLTHKEMGDVQAKLREMTEARDKLAGEVADLKSANQRLQTFEHSVQEKDRAVSPSIIEKHVELTVDKPATPGAKPEEAAIAGGNVIIITYPRTAVALNDRSKADLAKVLEPHRAQLAGAVADLQSFMGSETYSEGRRMAYYRALDLRNFLLDRKFVGAGAVRVTINQSKEPGDARIEIRFVRH